MVASINVFKGLTTMYRNSVKHEGMQGEGIRVTSHQTSPFERLLSFSVRLLFCSFKLAFTEFVVLEGVCQNDHSLPSSSLLRSIYTRVYTDSDNVHYSLLQYSLYIAELNQVLRSPIHIHGSAQVALPA